MYSKCVEEKENITFAYVCSSVKTYIYIFAHDNISKTFLPLYITNMQSNMIHRREGLCLVYPMAYERLS